MSNEQARNRKRDIQIHFMVNGQEQAQIREKMELAGVGNTGAHLRKMAIDGYIIRLDLSDVRGLVSLLRRCSNNLNQYTKKAHETNSIYAADMEHLSQMLSEIWTAARKILTTLSKL